MPTTKSYQYFDSGVMENLRAIMGDDIVELFSIFADDSRNRLTSLEELFVSTPDPHQVRIAAHSLKGSSANVGAVYLAELCFKLEIMARNNELNQAQEVLSEIKSVFRNMQSELADITTRH